MLLYLLLCVIGILLGLFLYILNQFLIIFRRIGRHVTGYIVDCRIDEYFRKATMVGEIASMEVEVLPEKKLERAYEKAMSVVTDVLLQNGYDPRQWNLRGMVMLTRISLGLKFTEKGGEKNGKGQGPTVQYRR